MRLKLLAAGLALVLVSVAACSDDGDGEASSDTTTSSPDTTDAAADDTTGDETPTTGIVASDDERAEQIVRIVEDAIPELALQSVVFGVWVGDEELVRGALDAPSNRPPTDVDALVRVGQPMEAMLGTVLLQLDEEGVVDMDAPVDQYLPELVNAEAITPRMLANSTSGTPDYVPNSAFQDTVYGDPFAGVTYGELLGFAQQSPPLFEPGTQAAYSHTDMASLVEVLEQASGQELDQLLAARIFAPLGMDHSSAHQDAEIGAPTFRAFTNERGVYEESTTWDPTWGLNGGMNASVIDLSRWLRALNDGELLTDEDAELSLAPDPDLPPLPGGLHFSFGSLVSGGWIIGNPSLNGYQGFTAQQREPSVTIVVWSTAAPANTGGSNASAAIGQQIADVVSDEPLELP